jgi:hypothetical protein
VKFSLSKPMFVCLSFIPPKAMIDDGIMLWDRFFLWKRAEKFWDDNDKSIPYSETLKNWLLGFLNL